MIGLSDKYQKYCDLPVYRRKQSIINIHGLGDVVLECNVLCNEEKGRHNFVINVIDLLV